MMKPLCACSVFAAIALGVMGCSSSATTTTVPDSGPVADSGTSDAPAAMEAGGATFTEVYAIISANCMPCHFAATPTGNLDMSTKANAYMNLVGKPAAGPSCGTSGLTRVVAGSAATSLIYHKIHDAMPPCGSQMPFNGTPLRAADQQTFADWINAGAKND